MSSQLPVTTTSMPEQQQLQEDDEEDWRHDEDFLALDQTVDKTNNNNNNEQEDVGGADFGGEYDSMDESSSSSNEEDYDDIDPMVLSRKKRPPPWMMGRPRTGGSSIQSGGSNRRGDNSHPNNPNRRNNRNDTRTTSTTHPLTALHNEIVQFVQLMEPLPSEIEQREKLVGRIRDTVQTHIGDHAQIHVFGSQATGLMLPTSDIDCVVMTTTTQPPSQDDDDDKEEDDEKQQQQQQQDFLTPLQRFYIAMQQPEWKEQLSYLEKLEHTRIPLVKFTHRPTNISVDVSFDQPSGPPAAQLMKQYLQKLPPLRPLTFVLKYFLAARGLNEPYSGGVGSFMLQLLIVAFLQHRERDAVNYNRSSPYNLGALLLDFLELYGMEFNYLTTGISVQYDGFFFPKGAADRRNVFVYNNRREATTNIMALENPLDPTQNVGASSFRYPVVQRAFAVAFKTLLAHVTANPNEHYYSQLETPSLLATILPPTDYMTSRLVLKRRDQALSSKRHRSDDDPRDSSKRQRR